MRTEAFLYDVVAGSDRRRRLLNVCGKRGTAARPGCSLRREAKIQANSEPEAGGLRLLAALYLPTANSRSRVNSLPVGSGASAFTACAPFI